MIFCKIHNLIYFNGYFILYKFATISKTQGKRKIIEDKNTDSDSLFSKIVIYIIIPFSIKI